VRASCVYISWLAAALLLPAVIAFAGRDEIEHYCTTRYPNVWQYFAWKDCVKTETQHELEESLIRERKEQARQREEQARPCLADDLSRMESLATNVTQTVQSEWSLEEAQAALTPIIGGEGQIQVATDNIKDRALVYSIRTKCDSPSHFLINIRAGPDQKLRWLGTWAEDPPAGYKAGLHSEFSVDFDAQRAQERSRAQQAEREAERARRMAEPEERLALAAFLLVVVLVPAFFPNVLYLSSADFRNFLLIIVCITIAAFVFGVIGDSTATISGSQTGGFMWQLGGSAAAFVIFYLVLSWGLSPVRALNVFLDDENGNRLTRPTVIEVRGNPRQEMETSSGNIRVSPQRGNSSTICRFGHTDV
jgi:hypothetical protein